MLPRALGVLFNLVEGRLDGRLDVQPRGFSDVCLVSGRDEEAARRLKRATLRLGVGEPPPTAGKLTGSRAASEESLAASSLYCSQESLDTSIGKRSPAVSDLHSLTSPLRYC